MFFIIFLYGYFFLYVYCVIILISIIIFDIRFISLFPNLVFQESRDLEGDATPEINLDTYKELLRQRQLLERTVETLQKKATKDAASHRSKVMGLQKVKMFVCLIEIWRLFFAFLFFR